MDIGMTKAAIGGKRRIAVVGSGISGLSCAWLLSKSVDVVLYETENRPGGHSNTVLAPGAAKDIPVDTGFIVYNDRNYPNLVKLFEHLDVPTLPSNMSFAASLGGDPVQARQMFETAIQRTGGNFLTAKPVGVVDGIDYGFTGAVRKVIADEIVADLDQQNVVLMSSLGVSPAGEIFNMSMEAVAEAVAIALKAEKLIYLCDAPGLLDAKGALIEAITADDAESRLKTGEGLTEDLDLYLPCAIRAVRQGVGRAHLIDRDKDGGLLLEFFTPLGVGTVLTRDPLFRLREATVEDVGALSSVIAPMEADGTLVRRSRERLEEEIERFTVVEYDGVLVGCAALYPFMDDRAAEMACVAVVPEHRRAGLGEMLLRRMEGRARALGVERLFVLTTRTSDWFRERGFRAVPPEALPSQKREMYDVERRSKVFMKAL